MICFGQHKRLTIAKALRLDIAHTFMDIVGVSLTEHLARAGKDFMIWLDNTQC
jgi:hypothetical protein